MRAIKRMLIFLTIMCCFEHYGMQPLSLMKKTKQKGGGRRFYHQEKKKKHIPFFAIQATIGFGVGALYAFKTKYYDDLYNNIKDHEIVRNIVRDISHRTSEKIMCNLTVPWYDFLVEKVEKEIYNALIKVSNQAELVEKINNIITANVKNLLSRKVGLTEESAKNLAIFGCAVFSFILVCASARVWHNLGVLGFTIGTTVNASLGGLAGEKTVDLILQDRAIIPQTLASIYQMNIDSVELILNGIVSELLSISQQELSKRQAGILYIYSNKLNRISAKELEKLEFEQGPTASLVKNIPHFFSNKNIRFIVQNKIKDLFNMLVDYYENKGYIRHVFFEWLFGLQPGRRRSTVEHWKQIMSNNEEFFSKTHVIIISDDKFFEKLALMKDKLLTILFSLTINTCENPVYTQEEISLEGDIEQNPIIIEEVE